MKKIVITENQKGLSYKNGSLEAVLGAGKYYEIGSRRIEVVDAFLPIAPEGCSAELVAERFGNLVTVVDVAAGERVLRFCSGRFCASLSTGRHYFWANERNEFKRFDISAPELALEQMASLAGIDGIVGTVIKRVSVSSYETARLYINGALTRLLGAGCFYFWADSPAEVRVEREDMRERRIDVVGQSVLTADKVGVRVNFILMYKVTDALKIAEVSENIEEHLYAKAQLILRSFISKYKVDEILENRERISEEVIEGLKNSTANDCVEITSAGIKDIILPGEIAEIMNSVLAAEKRAQANVITRREEVASTRSLLNTAKLMDENATLRRLKELEYLEKICENVGNITVDGSKALLSQLGNVLTDVR